jgi:hypothetical protein
MNRGLLLCNSVLQRTFNMLLEKKTAKACPTNIELLSVRRAQRTPRGSLKMIWDHRRHVPLASWPGMSYKKPRRGGLSVEISSAKEILVSSGGAALYRAVILSDPNFINLSSLFDVRCSLGYSLCTRRLSLVNID